MPTWEEYRKFLSRVALLAAAIAMSGCSLKAKQAAGGLGLKLRPAGQAVEDALRSLTIGPLLTTQSSPPLSGLGSKIGCFVVGAAGGSVPGGSTCSIYNSTTSIPGVFSGQSANIDDSYSMLIPISDGITFSAFGGFTTSSGNCDATTSAGGGTFLLGRVTASADDLKSVVEIPVAFGDPNSVFSCSSTPYQLFSDSLTEYSNGATMNASNTGNVWTGATNTGINPPASGGTGGVVVPSLSASVKATGVSVVFPVNKPYLSVRSAFNYTSVVNQPAVGLVAFTDSMNAGDASGAQIIFCGLKYPSGFGGSGTVTAVYGSAASWPGGLGTISFGTVAASGTTTLQCDVENNFNGTVNIYAHVRGSGGSADFSTTNFVFSFTHSTVFAVVGGFQQAGGGSTAGTITNFSVSAAEALQE